MPIDYPLLGEPLLIEFLNTKYVDGSRSIDFLADAKLARGWVIALSDRFGAPIDFDLADTAALRLLRDAIRLLTTTSGPTQKPKSIKDAISEINRAVSLAPRTRMLDWNVGRVTLAAARRPDSIASLLSNLAADAIDIIVGITPSTVEVCSRPECNLRFLRQHHRRRYCNERCASADRQSRYYHRTSTAP